MKVHIYEVKMRRIKRIQWILFAIIAIWGILLLVLPPNNRTWISALAWLLTVVVMLILGVFYDRLYLRNNKRVDDLYYERLHDLEVRKCNERQKRQMQA